MIKWQFSLQQKNKELKKSIDYRVRQQQKQDTIGDGAFTKSLRAAFPDKNKEKTKEQKERLEALEGVKKKANKRNEDEIAYLSFRKGTQGKDPGPEVATNPYQQAGEEGEKKYQYNYFVARSASKATYSTQMHPGWIEDIFDLVFVELCRRFPACWFPVPIGRSGNVIAPSDLVTTIPIEYQQHDKDYCITYSLASALKYLGEDDVAASISLKAEEWSKLPGTIAIHQVLNLLAKKMPKNGSCEVFNKKRAKKRKGSDRLRVMSVDDLVKPTLYLTLVHPHGMDGSSDHAVCVVDDLIFDARIPHALKLTAESLDWVCGIQGLEKLGPVYRFSQPHGIKKKYIVERSMVRHW